MKKIQTIPQNSTLKFHRNNYVKKLVDLFLDMESEKFFNNLIAIFQFSSKNYNKVEEAFEKLDKLYSKKLEDKHSLSYFRMKSYLLNIYKQTKETDNIRGAFLEALTLRNEEKKYFPQSTDIDCFIKIDEWVSSKTVDVCIFCDEKGKIYECKVGIDDLKESHIENLKEIKNKSSNKLNPIIVTLVRQKILEMKLKKIERKIGKRVYNSLGVKNISFIVYENFYDFMKQH